MYKLLEVDLRHDVLELQSAGRFVRSLRHVGILDDFGRFTAEMLENEPIAVDDVGGLLQRAI